MADDRVRIEHPTSKHRYEVKQTDFGTVAAWPDAVNPGAFVTYQAGGFTITAMADGQPYTPPGQQAAPAGPPPAQGG